MRRARHDDGFALISAIMISFIVLAVGLALLAFTDSQQRNASYEQSREGAYSLAEAALNAQIAQLNNAWPSIGSPEPTSCNHSTPATIGCPDNSFDSAYAIGGGACPAGTASDPWGAPTTNGWTTYVRDDSAGTSQLFSSTMDLTQPGYDAGGAAAGVPDGALWVRAVGVENCKEVAVVARVSQILAPLTVPQAAVTANSFSTGNNGKKLIIDTSGTYATPSNPNSQPGGISMRCQNVTPCANYRSGTQISPDTCGYNATTNTCTNTPSSPPATFTTSQLTQLQQQAAAYNSYWPAGNCPSTLSQLTSPTFPGGVAPVYITGPCNLSFSGGTANSSTSPGFLVLANGSLSLSGNATLYGLVYAANQQNSTGNVISITGTALIQGAIDVDGSGAIQFGSSARNFIYDSRVFGTLKTWGGTSAAPNSFRILPSGQ